MHQIICYKINVLHSTVLQVNYKYVASNINMSLYSGVKLEKNNYQSYTTTVGQAEFVNHRTYALNIIIWWADERKQSLNRILSQQSYSLQLLHFPPQFLVCTNIHIECKINLLLILG